MNSRKKSDYFTATHDISGLWKCDDFAVTIQGDRKLKAQITTTVTMTVTAGTPRAGVLHPVLPKRDTTLCIIDFREKQVASIIQADVLVFPIREGIIQSDMVEADFAELERRVLGDLRRKGWDRSR